VRILALETSGRFGSVAAMTDDKLLAEIELNPALRSASSLAPAIKELLARAGWRPTDVQLTAVTVGPGSFTGLRIGVTTAKTFAYAVGSAVVGVNTLEAVARRAAAETRQRLSAVLEAGRGQLFEQTFERGPAGEWQASHDTRLVSVDEWLVSLAPEIAVTGPALSALEDRIPAGMSVVASAHWHPTAAQVAAVGRTRFSGGQQDDIYKLAPLYLRRSAAEEKHAT
jgi:tRNA threonylcarbamoyladenosine biosynthesis protein TsaB